MLDTLRNELTAGKFALSLPHCELRQCGTDLPRVYSGAGFVSQEADGNLMLRMFSYEKLEERERHARLVPEGHEPGMLIPDTSYYDLKAVDQNGENWRACRQSIKEIFGVGNEIHVPLTSLEKVEALGKPGNTRGKGWFIPGDIELPWHVSTNTERRMTVDRFEFEDDGFAWKAHKVDGGLDVSITVKGQLLEPHATRFLRALGMMVGRAMNPLISYFVGTGELVTRIHPRQKSERSSLPGPIGLRLYEHHEAHWFLACCLHRAEQTHPKRKDQLLVLYRFWYRILRAHQGDIENSSLVLSVAIEGTVKALFHSEHDTDGKFSELVKQAMPSIEALSVDERVRTSMVKSLENSMFPKPKDTMLRLKDQGVITDSHITAWVKMRNTGAHGTLLEDDTNAFQAHLTRYFCCLDLFYRLLFLAIGFQGKYIDRSCAGWPSCTFPYADDATTFSRATTAAADAR